MSIVTCGIDCGYRTGGVALVGENWSEVHDLPVYSEGGVDVVALMDILTSLDRLDHIWIERQQAMPKQGVSRRSSWGMRLARSRRPWRCRARATRW